MSESCFYTKLFLVYYLRHQYNNSVTNTFLQFNLIGIWGSNFNYSLLTSIPVIAGTYSSSIVILVFTISALVVFI